MHSVLADGQVRLSSDPTERDSGAKEPDITVDARQLRYFDAPPGHHRRSAARRAGEALAGQLARHGHRVRERASVRAPLRQMTSLSACSWLDVGFES